MQFVQFNPSVSFHRQQTTSTRGMWGLSPLLLHMPCELRSHPKHGYDKKVLGLKNMCVRTKDNSKLHGGWETTDSPIPYIVSTF
ncbi:hypothetical protein QQF64_026770 [Cirrhinus molitorella]|uniref:Uncharacterized protein n=1 Tax=Cirrhinus molitorella TaxID=172907 RepID=A0ABR3NAG6_9TELE